MPGIHKSGNRSYRQKWSHPEKIQFWWKVKEENRDLLVEDLRSRSNLKGLFTKYFYLSNLAETSFPQIVFLCFICVYLFISVFCICVYLLVLLFRFGRVVRHWAGCTALPPPPLEFSPPWARGQDPSLSSTTGSGKRAFLSRLPILNPQGAWNHFHVPLIWAMA